MEKKIIRVLIFVGFLVPVTVSYAQSSPRVKDFYSPYFMGGTASVTDEMPPESDALNPASSALVQRTTLDLNYSGIIGSDGAVSGYRGHAFNIGSTFPTRAGVFSVSGHLLTSPFPSFFAPLSLALSGSFSKDLYPNLLIGTGIKVALSQAPGAAASVDFGALYFPGDIGFLKDAVVGLALQDVGWISIPSGYEDPYTMTAGIQGTLLKNKDFTIHIKSDLGFPGFKSVLFSLGGSVTFRDFVSLSLGSRVDVNALSHGNTAGLIPSVGLNFSFQTSIDKKSNFLGISENGWNKSDVRVQTDFAALAPGLWTYGTGVNIPLGVRDATPPVIKLDLSGFKTESMRSPDHTDPVVKNGSPERVENNLVQKRTLRKKRYVDEKKVTSKKSDRKRDRRYPGYSILTYLSPNNDGIKDDLVIPLTIKDSRYIKGYALVIRNVQGTIVRKIKNKEKRPENAGFKGILDRLLAVKSGITVPSKLRWDGFNNTGSAVPDGVYFFHVEAWDDNGNVSKTKDYAVVVDTTPPEVTITPPSDADRIFSPNNDGNKDTLTFLQTGSREDTWTGIIRNADNVPVRTFTWVDASPGKVVWNGENDEKVMVPDGVYSYSITATDRAGNTTTKSFDNIIKNTENTPITLVIDKQYFSPNNDSVQDTLVFTPGIHVRTGIVSWTLRVFDSKGAVRRTFEGKDAVPSSLIFDGRAGNGIILEEGTYHAVLTVSYKNGNLPTANSPDFIIDVTPPSATVRTNTPVFSPNGDGEKDTIKIFQETSLEKVWTASIKSVTGTAVYNYRWIGTAPAEISWNGIGLDGRLQPDGVYTYQLHSVDEAGNTGESNIVSFRLDTEKTAVILTTGYSAFSPNNDGIKDYITLIPKVTVREGISSYTLSILSSSGAVVRTFQGKKNLPDTFRWDGTDSKGNKVPDGRFSARLSLIYDKGDKPEAVSQPFTVDTVFPKITLSPQYLLFSPDGDGKKDTLKIKQVSDSKELWRGEIIDAQQKVVKTVFWKNGVTDFSWDGTDTAGNHVKDGVYTYRVSAVDEAGNATEKEIRGIEVDTSPTKIFITASAAYISPTGNGKFDDITFKPLVLNKKGIMNWSLELVRTGGTVEKTFTGLNRIPEKIIWDGANNAGTYVEGSYTAVFRVVYKKGNEPEVRTAPFILDVTPPKASVTLSPLPFSPDNDGVNDELTIALHVEDMSGIKNWELAIDDPENRPFIRFHGYGNPAKKIIWNGKSSTGELVYAAMDYPLTFTVEDILGNTTVIRKKIPIDVLVVREGDHLKIKIANIIFRKNSPELVSSDPKIAARNEFVLNRISEILNKYKSYQIVIRGYAVVTKWYDPAAAKIEEEKELIPLSRERAQTVLKDLVKRGVAASRMEAFGAGGKNPLVPNSDLENRWKNRRVEFILRKK